MTMGKKKVFHIIQSLDNGGCENMLLRTLPLLSDFEHTILTLKKPGELAPKFALAEITVETVRCNHLLSIAGICRLRNFVRAKNPDIVITYLFHADFLGRLTLQNTTKALIIPFLRTTYNHPRYRVARFFEWLTKPLIKQYLANSKAVKDFYARHIGVTPEKITVISNGIDTDYFDSLVPDPALQASLGIRADDFVIICVANLHPNKGHKYLLEAFEQLHTPHPVIPSKAEESRIQKRNIKLLIVGDGDERGNLRQQITNYQSKDNILFLGRRPDVPELLKISHLFALPTFFEGMSNALMEAMAAGLPVITTDIEENRELVKNHETGVLVPVKNSDAIADAIEKLLTNEALRSQIGQAAKKFMEEHFSLKKIANDWNKLLTEYTRS